MVAVAAVPTFDHEGLHHGFRAPGGGGGNQLRDGSWSVHALLDRGPARRGPHKEQCSGVQASGGTAMVYILLRRGAAACAKLLFEDPSLPGILCVASSALCTVLISPA